jgi:hypothetical protein
VCTDYEGARGVVAAIAVGSLKTRFTEEEFLGFAAYLTEKTVFISRQLGYMSWNNSAV